MNQQIKRNQKMTQSLKDILKQAHDRIKGVHASQTTAGSTGKDPGVDYAPKAGDEDEFVAKHSVEKWDDPQATDDQRHGGRDGTEKAGPCP